MTRERELTLAELSDFTNAKVGDKCFDLLNNYGTIVCINKRFKLCFVAETNRGFATFSKQGLALRSDSFPTWFNRPVKIVVDTEDGK